MIFQMTESKSKGRWEHVFILMVYWIAVLAQDAPYYQREYSGYRFTIPYFNIVQQRTQSDAQNWCTGHGISLLEILNASVQDAVVQSINDAKNQIQLTENPIITGGRENVTSSWSWLTGFTFPPGFSVARQEGGQAYSYGYLNTSSSGYSIWADFPTTQMFYICEINENNCSNGYLATNGRCYQSFNSDRLSWYDSRNRCLERGGDLASFEWITTNQGLNVLNGSWLTSSEYYWIGLRRPSWKWQYSNIEVKYSQWSNGHPAYDWNQICICLLPQDWKWGECSCKQSYQFVCISASPSSSSSSASSPSSSSMLFSSSATHSISSSSTQTKALASAAITSSSTSSTPSPSSEGVAAVNSLAIGLGVGLGGAVLIAIIIVAVLLALKYNMHKRFSKRTLPPHVTLTGVEATHYAVVQSKNQPVEDDSTSAYNTIPSNNSSAEYAPIVIQGAKTATIGPPKLPKSTANFSVLYAQVNK